MKRFLRFVVKSDFIKRFFKSFQKKGVSPEGEDTGQTREEDSLNVEKHEAAAEANTIKTTENERAESVDVDTARIEPVQKAQEEKPQTLPNQALICIGEYPAKILAKGQLSNAIDAFRPIFIGKSSEGLIRFGKDALDTEKIAYLDANVDTQFWYQVSPYLAENQELFEKIRGKLEGNKYGVLTVSSLWEGIGSATSPILVSKLKEWNLNTVTLALSPSRLQPSAAHFNAFSSIGMCLAKETATVILLGRDQLNKYAGVDRTGAVIKGNMVLNSLIELMLAKTTFVNELSEISRSFNVKIFTILAATGASLRIYGSLENILDTTLFRPLQSTELISASVLYVLVRLPRDLREKLTRDRIELAVADWFKEKAILKSVYVTEPLYVEDANDRVDLLLFLGGANVKDALATMEKKGDAIKTQALKQGSIKEEDWKVIVKDLGQL